MSSRCPEILQGFPWCPWRVHTSGSGPQVSAADRIRRRMEKSEASPSLAPLSSEEVGSLPAAVTLPQPDARLQSDCRGLDLHMETLLFHWDDFPQEGSAFEQFGHFPEKQKHSPLLAAPRFQALPGSSASGLKELFNLRSAPVTSRAS